MANEALFQPGREKTGGRQKGVGNKTTTEQKEIIHNFLTDNWSKAVEAMNKMDGYKFIDSYVKLAKFVWPTMTKNDTTATITGGLDIKVSFEDLKTRYTTGQPVVQDLDAATSVQELSDSFNPSSLAMLDLDMLKNEQDEEEL